MTMLLKVGDEPRMIRAMVALLFQLNFIYICFTFRKAYSRNLIELMNKLTTCIDEKNHISQNAKKELLPLLKNIELLTNHRDNYSKKIEQIDIELEKVKNEIVNIKKSYEKNITDLQNNINFFEQSITLIEKIREEG